MERAPIQIYWVIQAVPDWAFPELFCILSDIFSDRLLFPPYATSQRRSREFLVEIGDSRENFPDIGKILQQTFKLGSQMVLAILHFFLLIFATTDEVPFKFWQKKT